MENQSKKKADRDTEARENGGPKGGIQNRKVNKLTGLLSLIFLGILFFVALAFAFHYGQSGKSIHALWWGIAAAICALIGVGLYVQQNILQQRETAKATDTDKPKEEAQPSVAVYTINLLKPLAVGEYPTVRVIFQNGPRVPIEGFASRARLVAHNKSIADAMKDFPLGDFQSDKIGNVLIEGQQRVVDYPQTSFVMDGTRLAFINAGALRLYVIGKAAYRANGHEYSFPFYAVYDPSDGGFNEPENPGPAASPKTTTATSATPLSIADRPYVVVESASIPDLAPNRPLSPVITIVNKGRTPAQHVAMSLEIAAKAGYIYVLGFGPDSGRRPVEIAFLAAGDRVSVGGAPADAVSVDSKFFSDAMEGKESFMIHGQGTYDDMAGTEYPIEYSFGYHPQAKGFIADFLGPNRVEKWQGEKEKKKKPRN